MVEEHELMLSPEDAFAAMFEFLSRYWSEFKTANVADVLGDLQPAYGGRLPAVRLRVAPTPTRR